LTKNVFLRPDICIDISKIMKNILIACIILLDNKDIMNFVTTE